MAFFYRSTRIQNSVNKQYIAHRAEQFPKTRRVISLIRRSDGVWQKERITVMIVYKNENALSTERLEHFSEFKIINKLLLKF